MLDRSLPDLDGLELCQSARARESDTYLPILMLTALVSNMVNLVAYGLAQRRQRGCE